MKKKMEQKSKSTNGKSILLKITQIKKKTSIRGEINKQRNTPSN